jgi:hypothetical protein
VSVGHRTLLSRRLERQVGHQTSPLVDPSETDASGDAKSFGTIAVGSVEMSDELELHCASPLARGRGHVASAQDEQPHFSFGPPPDLRSTSELVAA